VVVMVAVRKPCPPKPRHNHKHMSHLRQCGVGETGTRHKSVAAIITSSMRIGLQLMNKGEQP